MHQRQDRRRRALREVECGGRRGRGDVEHVVEPELLGDALGVVVQRGVDRLGLTEEVDEKVEYLMLAVRVCVSCHEVGVTEVPGFDRSGNAADDGMCR